MKVTLYGRRIDEPYVPYLVSLVEQLRKHEAEIAVYTPYSELIFPLLDAVDDIRCVSTPAEIAGYTDYLFSIGGDGTMLSALPLIQDSGIPVVGINIGRLGFLSSISKDEISSALEKLKKGNYILDRRTMLRVSSSASDIFKGNVYGLNELTVNKTDTSNMITVDVTVNGLFFSRYWADGLIISTPTGSTAYNLSCGGPVIMPESNSFAITAIAPHNLNVRPIVIPDSSEIKLKVHSRSGHFLASLDSNFVNLSTGDEITVKKNTFTFNIVRLNEHDYINTLRNKLLWGSDMRNTIKFGN
jgi:NAD+ kinase